MTGELPANHAAREDIDDEREEHHAFPTADVGEVRHVEPIGRRGGEVALHEIRQPRGVRVGFGRDEPPAAALGATDAVGAHQPLDAIAPDIADAGAPQRQMHLAVAVGLMQPADRRDEQLVTDRAGRPLAAGAPVCSRLLPPRTLGLGASVIAGPGLEDEQLRHHVGVLMGHAHERDHLPSRSAP